MEIYPEIALEYARQYSCPRQVGSTEEEWVAQEIKVSLESFGYKVHFQPFKFSTASEVFLFLEILSGLVIIMSSLLTLGISQWLTFFQTALLILLFLIIGPLNNKVQRSSLKIIGDQRKSWWSSICWKLGRCYTTKNIIATIPATERDRTLPQLFLVAHYDSKSQHLPLVIRIALFVILIVGSLVFAPLILLSMFAEAFTPLSIVVGLLVILAGVPLLFLDYGNDSPGAIDDASGVGLVLHLAETIAKQPQLLRKLGITILITSAEELAVKGALAYVSKNNQYLRQQASESGLQVLNFDGVGVDGKIYLVGGPSRSSIKILSGMVQESAQELGIPVGRFSLPGALFDHIPFIKAGYDAISLIGIGKSTWSIHTAQDSPDKLHIRGFDQTGRLAVRVMEKLAGVF